MKQCLDYIRRFAIKNGNNVYIVGGYVRDKFINNNPTDIDIVYDGCVDNLINYLKAEGYKIIFIKEELHMYKVILNYSTIDIVKMKGNNILSDLSKRDYTVNAIAQNLIDESIIDPFNGVKHIKLKLLKQVNENSLSQDRIRILRGIRLKLKYNMKFSLETEKNLRQQAKYIKQSTKERFLNEFMNIIECDKDGNAFKVMDKYEVLREIIPYIDELKSVGKCKYHKVNAYTHMNTVYKVYKEVVSSKIKLRGIENIEFYMKIGNHYLKDYIAVAAFTHDIGKYLCYNKSKNSVSFKGHDEVGAEIMNKWCNYWLFPKYATKVIVNIIKGHMQPFKLIKSQIKDYKKNFYKFFNEYGDMTPYILIIYFCDMYATYLYLEDSKKCKTYKQFIENAFNEYNRYKMIKKNRIINGTDVINMTHITGRRVKEILEIVDEERYIGKINNRTQCEKFIKKFIM